MSAPHGRLGTRRCFASLLQVLIVSIVAASERAFGQEVGDGTPTPPPPAGHGDVDDAALGDDLAQLDLEDLMGIEVTSVSKKKERRNDAAAAVFVVTSDDIRRLGARSIPEALRIVPGLEVARIGRHRWSLSARGFNGPFANKLLVLIDGRTVYSPLFSGVIWNDQDVFIDDVERIEVIRGPAAALWGANAVNGVINVITKSARATRGGFARAGIDTSGGYEADLRYGDAIGEDGAFRIWMKAFARDGFVDRAGRDAHDDWDQVHGGFRIDAATSPNDELMVSGDAYAGRAEQTLRPPTLANPLGVAVDDLIDNTGANIIARWTHQLSPTSEFSLQTYVEYWRRSEFYFESERVTGDFEAQHRFALGESHDFIWGIGYRASHENIDGSTNLFFTPSSRTTQLVSLFAHDDVTLVPDVLHLTVGARVEHNDFSGLELQPTLRIIWIPAAEHRIWTAVSRAVRAPSLADHDLNFTQAVIPAQGMTPPVRVSLRGRKQFRSEELIAVELGWRWEPAPNLKLDLATFINFYDELRTTEFGAIAPGTSPPPHLVQTVFFGNRGEGRSWGAEVAAAWRPCTTLALSASYSYIDFDLDLEPGSTAPDVDFAADRGSPRHRFDVRASWDPMTELSVDTVLFFVGPIDGFGTPSYWRWDVRVAWRPDAAVELAAGVQNILEQRHPESIDLLARLPREIERLAYFEVIFTF